MGLSPARLARSSRPADCTNLVRHETAYFLTISWRRQSESAAIAEEFGDRLRAEAVVQQLQLIGGNERRMWHTAGATECEHVLPERQDVIGEPRRLERGIQPAHEPWMPSCETFRLDRKSTRLNSSHGYISYAV